ncbi:amino acid permease, partial [bacterium]|nr:amino acid permease [bacterium]
MTNNGIRRFGIFGGVFVPNVLTLLGVILFLRLGWIVGQGGLLNAWIIIIIAHLITFSTGLSLSAIATNVEVKTGGAYYLISRSLGLEVGGSIGIPLFLSQALSVAFYIIGFTESLSAVFPSVNTTIVASTVCLLFAMIAYRGADFAIKLQYGILAILLIAIISLFLGVAPSDVVVNYNSNYTQGVNFWYIFAVFFPATIGIMTGAGMSGDLKDPGKSIPKGTLWAILFTFIVYMVVAYKLANLVPAEILRSDVMAPYRAARIPTLVLLGIWAATLSSALTCIVVAPRTLQALANDNVVPRIFGKKMGSKTEPRFGVIVSFVIAELLILKGELNFSAALITMFFLSTYGMTNLVAALEKIIGSPSYRPKFKVHWIFSFLGAVGCYVCMFLIHAPATIIAIIVSSALFIILEKRSINRTWGDVRSGVWFTLARFGLIRLEGYKWHPRNWRPNIMVFSGNPTTRLHIIHIAMWLAKAKGIISFFQLVVDDLADAIEKGLKERTKDNLRQFIKKNNLHAFAETAIVSDFSEGVKTIVQSHGVGGLKPNVVLFGLANELEGQVKQIKLVRDLNKLEKSVMILNWNEGNGFGKEKIIDVWWRGRKDNGDLMLLIAHLISLSWKGSKVRVIMAIDNPKGQEPARKNIQDML